jgi:hypothetical protein
MTVIYGTARHIKRTSIEDNGVILFLTSAGLRIQGLKIQEREALLDCRDSSDDSTRQVPILDFTPRRTRSHSLAQE